MQGQMSETSNEEFWAGGRTQDPLATRRFAQGCVE